MPGLSEKTYEEAKQTLEGLGLVPVFSYGYDPQVEQGYVVSQTPEIGAVVKPGEEVYVLISLGRDRVLAMPEVLGRKEEEALSILDEQGIANVTVQYVDLAEQEAGIVVGQSPDAETRVLEGESVTIIVNRPQQNNAPAQAGNAQQAPQA